jgi:hypothetical protein
MKSKRINRFGHAVCLIAIFALSTLSSAHLMAQNPFYNVTGFGYQGGIITALTHPQGGFLGLAYGNGDFGGKTILVRYSESGDTLWTKTYVRYGSLVNRWAVNIAAASDQSGFYLLLKEHHSGYGNPVCNAIMKVDLDGDSLWNVQVSSLYEWSNAYLGAIKSASDGGLILAGANSSYNARIFKKINSEGGIEWTNEAPTDIYPRYANVVEASDGSYFGIGLSSGWQPTGPHDSRLAVRKVTAGGSTIWDKAYHSGNLTTGDSIRSEGYDVVAMGDGGCIVVGYMTNPGVSRGPALLMRLDENGDTLWTKKLFNSTTSQYIAYKIEPTADGNYLVYMDRGSSSAEARLVKINAAGETLWIQHGYNYWMVMKGIASDGGVILNGSHDWYGFFIKASHDGMYLGPNPHLPWNGQTNLVGPTSFKWDLSGAQQQTMHYQLQLSTDENFTTIVIDQNNITENMLDVYNLNSYTLYYWRTRAYGPEGGYGLWSTVYHFTTGEIVGMDEISESTGFSLSQNFPNPSSDKTTINVHAKREIESELIISDVSGRIVYSRPVLLTSGRNELTIDLDQFNAGIYFYTLISPKGKQSKMLGVVR